MYRKSVLSAAILALLFCSVKAETGVNICSGGDIVEGTCVRFLDCDDDLVNTEYIDQQQANNLDARKAACSSSTVKMVCCLKVRKRFSKYVPQTCGNPPADNSTFGWTVLIGTGNFHRRCVGTLINDEFVLTTVDCIGEVNPNDITLFLGEVFVDTLPECSPEAERCQTYFAEKFIPHEDFDPINKQYNVALIKTAEKVSLGSQIFPICLPLNATEEDAGLEKRYILRPRIYNATNNIQETCGYSGAPIVVKDHEKRYQVVGVANHPVECDRKKVKRDATPLMEYVNWIITTLAQA